MDVEKIPLAAYESLSTRLCRVIRWLIGGWAISVFALGLALVISMSYTEDVMTETTEVAQEADNYGNNTFAGGDYYDSQTDGEGYEDEGSQAQGSGGAETDEQQAS